MTKPFVRLVEVEPGGNAALRNPWKNSEAFVEANAEPDYPLRIRESLQIHAEFWCLFTLNQDGTWKAECPTLGVEIVTPAKDDAGWKYEFADARLAITHAISEHLRGLCSKNALYSNLKSKGFEPDSEDS